MVVGEGINHQGAADAGAGVGSTAGSHLALSTAAGIGGPLRLRPERSPVMPSAEDRRRIERSYLRFTEVGIQFAATILLLTLLGIWLDGRLGTTPLFTIVLLLIGFGGATWNLVRTVLAHDRPPDEPDVKA